MTIRQQQRLRIAAQLEALGPLTLAELAAHLDLTQSQVWSAIKHSNKNWKRAAEPKWFTRDDPEDYHMRRHRLTEIGRAALFAATAGSMS